MSKKIIEKQVGLGKLVATRDVGVLITSDPEE